MKKDSLQDLLIEERKLWNLGFDFIGGIDEAGRGPLAGPVVATCVILPKDMRIEGVNDSKKLSPSMRTKLFDIIMDNAISVGIGRISSERIDSVNILNATYEAMLLAISNCNIQPDYLLVDAVNLKNCSIPQRSLIKGDAISHSIAAASIIAKVTRDREMIKWNQIYPQYAFDRHKGYGTAVHIQAIQEYGLCPIHRRSFCTHFI